jgi:hypothetical protein
MSIKAGSLERELGKRERTEFLEKLIVKGEPS